jgi:phosphoserine phosphatase RsbU/P
VLPKFLFLIAFTLNPTALDPSIHFFRNYNRIIGTAYGAIVLGLCVVFAYQFNQKFSEEQAVIQAHFERHAQFVEFVLRSSSDQLEALRMAASSELTTEAVSPSNLKQLGTSDLGFDLDATPDRDGGGNLIGTGTIKGRDGNFYRDINTGFALLPALKTLNFILPSATQARYISSYSFNVVSPWVAARSKPFNNAVYESPVWKLRTEDKGSDRAKYWAPAYFGNKDQGLLVPAAAPVFQGERFAGIVTIDTSIDYLNRINSGFGYALGTPFLIDSFGSVLAHPHLYVKALSVEKTPAINEALPTDLSNHIALRHNFVSAPWQLVYIVPRPEVWKKLIIERGVLMAAVLAGLMLMMLTTYRVTSQEFVSPAAKLVQHLATESRFTPANIPAVPSAWRPWFETVSKAFRESLQLVGLRQELSIAAQMQAAILPRNWPVHADYTVWGTMRSAKEVGGDFYDHFPAVDGRLGIVVADVSGKGIPAALFGMVSKTLLRAIATRATSQPNSVIAEVNDGLCEDNDSCMFVTTLYTLFDPKTGQLDYVNAGHPPPLTISANGTAKFLDGTDGIALGVVDGVPFKQAHIQLEAGETLLLFSDGVTEAMNAQSQEFGTERLQALFSSALKAGTSAKEIVEKVISAVDSFAANAEQSDDITCVALQYHPRGQPC